MADFKLLGIWIRKGSEESSIGRSTYGWSRVSSSEDLQSILSLQQNFQSYTWWSRDDALREFLSVDARVVAGWRPPDWVADGYVWDPSTRDIVPKIRSKTGHATSASAKIDPERRKMIEFFYGGKVNTCGCTCGAWVDGGGHYDWCDAGGVPRSSPHQDDVPF